MPGSCSHTGSHRRTEVFPLCSHIFSPGLSYCLKKIFKPFVSTHPINNSSFSLCPRACLCHLCGQAGQGWSAEQFGKTLQNDPTQLHLLCFVRVFEKLVIICHFKHTQAVVLFKEFWDLLGLRKTTGKKVKMWVPCSAILPRYYLSWHHFQIDFCMKWLGGLMWLSQHCFWKLRAFFPLLLPGF